MRLVGVIVLTVLVMAGCASDDSDSPEDDIGAEVEVLVDVEAAQGRYTEICMLVDGIGTDRCTGLVAGAIDDAVEAGCSDLTLEAYFEHFAAWSGDSEPGPDFFTTCPTPLSTMMLASPPEGFEPGGSSRSGGSLTTAAVARDHLDASGVQQWLEGLGHEVSHRSVWSRDDGADVLMIRLDRFATVDGAVVFIEPDPDDDLTVEVETVSGVLGGRITRSVLDGAQVERRYRQVATGRVCNVAITVHAMGQDEPIEPDLVREVFTQQARRAQVVVTC
jgi:hypothetical protein